MPATDLLSETRACDLLARLFRSRGYRIVRNIPFREYGVSFHIDGWDAKARVGFEFLSSEDEDHDDLSLEEYKILMAAQQRGELALFVIDEVEPLSAADLEDTVADFLDEIEAGRAARRGAKAAGRRQKKAAGKKIAKRRAGGKRAGKAAATKRKLAKKLPTKRAGKKSAKRAGKKAAKKTAKKAARKGAKKASRR
jgi:hypothetical protein